MKEDIVSGRRAETASDDPDDGLAVERMFSEMGANETAVLDAGIDELFPDRRFPHVDSRSAAREIEVADIEDEPVGAPETDVKGGGRRVGDRGHHFSAPENRVRSRKGHGALDSVKLIGDRIKNLPGGGLLDDENVGCGFGGLAQRGFFSFAADIDHPKNRWGG